MESTELARLSWVAGKQTTRLTHYGRKTGKSYEVTIWFVLDDDRLYIGTANAKRQWGLYLEESFSFRVATPEAAVALTA